MSLCAAFFSQDMDLEILRERLRRREEARQRARQQELGAAPPKRALAPEPDADSKQAA